MTRRISIALLTIVSLFLVACGGSSDEVSLDTDAISEAGFLGAAVDRSTAEGFDFDMTLDVVLSIPGAPGIDADEVAFGSGSVDGQLSSFRMDMAAMTEAMGAPADTLGSGDLSMEVITDGDAGVTYIRAPFFASLAGQPGIPTSGLGGLETLGDGWGRVDHSALGDAIPSELLGQMSGGAVGFEPMLELVRNAENAREIGSDEINGTTATGVAADITFDEMLGLSGMDLESLMGSFGAPSAEVDAIVSAMSELTIPITVWLDDDARVVRVEMVLDMAPMFERLGEQLGEEIPPGLKMSFGYTIDASNFGSPSDITVPEESTDITESYRELLSSMTGG